MFSLLEGFWYPLGLELPPVVSSSNASLSSCAFPILIGCSSFVFISYYPHNSCESIVTCQSSVIVIARENRKIICRGKPKRRSTYLDFTPSLVDKLFPGIRFPCCKIEPRRVINNRPDSIVQVLKVLFDVGEDLEEFFLCLEELFVLGGGDCLQDAFPGLEECCCVTE